jgi:hypothetical protein
MPTTVTPKPPFTATSNSVLIEDYIVTSDLLVDPGPASVAVLSSDGSTEALVVSGGRLRHAVQDSGSNTGWRIDDPLGGVAAKEVAAGLQLGGTSHGIYHDGSNLVHIRRDGAVWVKGETLPLCTHLKSTHTPAGLLIMYGITRDGNLQIVRQPLLQPGSPWEAATYSVDGALVEGDATLCFVDESSWTLAATVTGALTMWSGTLDNPRFTQGPTRVQNNVAQVVLGYQSSGSVLFMFVDQAKTLYSATVFATQTEPVQATIPNSTVQQAAGLLDDNQLLHIYSIDDKNRLWVLHQTDWGDDGPVWAPYIPLGTGLSRVVADSRPVAAAAVFAIAEDSGALQLHAQDPTTSFWSASSVQYPGGEQVGNDVPRYRTEITVVDANGNPAANQAVALGADSACGVSIGANTYHLDSQQSITVKTDPMGKITVSTRAEAVHTPSLKVAATGLTALPPIAPADAVQRYLSGKGTINGLPAFSGDTLKNATVNGRPLAPALSEKEPPISAQDAAAAISNAMSINFGPPHAGAPDAARPDVAGFAINLRDPSQPGFQIFATAEDLQAHMEQLGFTGQVGDIWDDLSQFASDVWQGIKTAANLISQVFVDIVHKTVQFASEEFEYLKNVTIRGIEDAVSLVHGVFNAIKAAVEDVIKWLQAVFDWADIWDTKNALRNLYDQVPRYLDGVIANHAKPLVSGYFTGLESAISGEFQAAKALFKADMTMLQLVTAAGPMPPRVDAGDRSEGNHATVSVGAFGRPFAAYPLFATPGGARIDPAAFHSSAQHNWMLDKVQTSLATVPPVPVVDSLSGPLSDLQTAFRGVETDVKAAFRSFWEAILAPLEHPQDFQTVAVIDVLDGIEHLIHAVLVAMDGIIEALLDTVRAILNGLNTVLTTPVTIPVLTGVINKILALLNLPPVPSVTVVDLFCLVAAIPLTVVYKLIHGQDAKLFPGGSYPAFPHDATSASGAHKPERPMLAADDPTAEAIHFCAVGILATWALYDTAIDAGTAGGEVPFYLGVIDIVFLLAAQTFTWPSENGVPATLPFDTKDQKVAFANWMMGWLYPLVDGSTLVLSALPDGSRGRGLLRAWEPAGKVVTSVLGALNVITGVIETSVADEGPGHRAANILGPFPRSMQFLMLTESEGDTIGISAVVKLVLDFFCGEGTAAAIAAGD